MGERKDPHRKMITYELWNCQSFRKDENIQCLENKQDCTVRSQRGNETIYIPIKTEEDVKQKLTRLDTFKPAGQHLPQKV